MTKIKGKGKEYLAMSKRVQSEVKCHVPKFHLLIRSQGHFKPLCIVQM